MSSPSDRFECHWRASAWLRLASVGAHLLALAACVLLDVPVGFKLLAVLACCLHAAWTMPRQVALSHPEAMTGLRRDRGGWQLFSARRGWQAVQLRGDSVALPGLVILRFRRAGQWFSRSVCIPGDALPREEHRRLRLRLKFSRRRWAPVR